VATDWLLTLTGYPMDGSTTPTQGDKFCLDFMPQCLLHTVTESNTCSSLLALAGPDVINLMLESWNPTIGHECLNLRGMIGKHICIGPPGQPGKFTPIVPSPVPPTSSPELGYPLEPAPDTVTRTVNFTTSYLVPTTDIIITTHTASPPDLANASAILERTRHCPFTSEGDEGAWNQGLAEDEYRVHSWQMEEDCHEFWRPYCYPMPHDPILPSPTDAASSCLPTVETITPEGWVDPPGPTTSPVPDQCNKWHLVGTGDTCAGIAAEFGMTTTEFLQLNPGINANCGNLRARFAVCVRVWLEPPEETTTTTTTPTTTAGPPGPTESGTSPTCSAWHIHVEGMRYYHLM
jgi:hypothetical protein